MKIKNLINMLEFFYPKSNSEDWDNVGLIIGDERKNVNRVLTTLEITNDVIDEAIEREVDLIVAHHPIIFHKISNLNYKDPYVRMYIKLIKNDIAVYSMHTNVDTSANGMSDWIAEILNLSQDSIFIPTKTLDQYEIKIEVQQENLYTLLEKLKMTGVGQGNGYIENAKLSPKVKYYSTSIDKVEQCDVVVVEATMHADIKNQVIYELNKNNFTQFTVTKLESNQHKVGLGKVGFVKPITLEDLASEIKELYKLDFCKIVGNREHVIKKVAILPGSGAEFITAAKKQGCDVLITGDIGFHDAQLAKAAKICLIDPGHNIEIIFNDAMAQIINMFDEVTAIASEIDTEPFEVI